jgi:integrase
MAKQTIERIHHICDGRVLLYRRNGNKTIYARAYIQGKDVRYCTDEEKLAVAEEKARDWWDELRAKDRLKQPVHGRLFSDVADAFIKWAPANKDHVVPEQIEQYSIKWKVLKRLPRDPKHPDGAKWFDSVLVTDVDRTFLVNLRTARAACTTQFKRPVSPATLKKDMDFIGMVLRYAMEVEKCISRVPEKPKFEGRYKIAKRAQKALTLRQYNRLIEAAVAHANQPTNDTRRKRQREELLAFIVLSVAAGLRPSEAYSLRWIDCRETTLNKQPAIRLFVKGKHFRTTGKREEGYAIYQGVDAWKRLRKTYPDDKDGDSLFTEKHADGVELLLTKTGLRTWTDEDGVEQLRWAKCFRPTGISMWLRMAEKVDLNDARKIFRTSIQEIQDCYDQNPVRSAASRMAKWKGDPKDYLKKEEVVADDAAWEQEDDEAPDAVPGELVGEELDELD